MAKRKALVAWSTGKDAAWALHLLRKRPDVEVVGLLTTVREPTERVTMHEIARELLDAQAKATELPVHTVSLPWPCPNEQYARVMGEAMTRAREQGIEAVAFGDVFLEDVRAYREQSLAQAGIEAWFPLWGKPTAELVREMLEGGLRARIACVDTRKLPASFAGRELDMALLDELPEGVDPCGERGELHTFAFAGPMFDRAIPVEAYAVETRGDFAYAELALP